MEERMAMTAQHRTEPEGKARTSTGGEVLAHLDDVSFAYDSGTVALEMVSCDVRRGEFLSLVGPSGCGKSTILRLLSELSRPSSGSIEWAKPAAGDSHAVSVVFQDATLLPWRSSLSNVGLPLELAGVGRRERREIAGEALERVGLGSHVDALPRELSGGMRMRVAIARALVGKPDLLVMDEPFGALDAITRERLQEELLEIWAAADCTVLFVTHSVDEAVFLSSRIAVMTPRPGRIARVFEVDMPSPRRPEIRNSDQFRDMREVVHRSLFEHLDSSGGTSA
jgi:NitT/TauT family transport system ATP-binding protein